MRGAGIKHTPIGGKKKPLKSGGSVKTDYKLAFYMLLTAVIVYFVCNTSFYIGSDYEKYKSATIGILLRK